MNFRTLTDTAKQPVRSTEQSAGLDVFADQTVYIPPYSVAMISTGVTFDVGITDGWSWFLGLYVRSSLGYKGIMLANGTGIIDADYAGKDIMVLLYNGNYKEVKIEQGEKIAQLVVQKHYSNEANGVTFKYDKREGGIGSTGE